METNDAVGDAKFRPSLDLRCAVLNEATMKKLILPLFLICGAFVASNAQSRPLCEPTAAAGNPTWTRVYVKPVDLKAGGTLPGLDGSRVVATDAWRPAPGEGRGKSLPWQSRVNWDAYPQPLADLTSSIIYVDADDKGVKYPCRVEARDLTETSRERRDKAGQLVRPGAADVRVYELTKIFYDQRSRIAGVAQFVLDDRHLALKREKTECFHYNRTDGFLGAAPASAETCTASSLEQIEERYVYTEAGKLLRRIDVEKSMPGLDGKPFVVKRAGVVVYSEAGQPIAEYAENEENKRYRRSLAANDDLTRYAGLKVIASANEIDTVAAQGGTLLGFWQIYSLPTKVANANDGVYESKYSVARGTRTHITSADKARLWAALQKQDHDLMLDAQGKFLLVPEATPAVWKKCINYRVNTVETCP